MGYGYQTWVGADMGELETLQKSLPLIKLAEKARDLAFAASGVASDTGSVTFKTHKAYAAAWKANRAAYHAWKEAGARAQKVLAVYAAGSTTLDSQRLYEGWVTDAKDRMGELDVAYKGLKDDYITNVQFKFPPPGGKAPQIEPKPWMVVNAPPGTTPEAGPFPIMSPAETDWKKIGLYAGGAALATKVLGWW